MIKIKEHAGNLIEITFLGELKSDDFDELALVADGMIAKNNAIRILINASDFDGWADISAAEKHFGFVKTHHQKVERLAIVTGHTWQHWLASMAKTFIHPEVKVFDKNQLEDARTWLA